MSFKEGQTIYPADERENFVYYLRSGRAKIHMFYSDGNNRITSYAEAPALLGVINVLPGHKTINNCSAVGRCELIAYPSERFLERVRKLDLMEKLFQYSAGMSRHIYSVLTALLTEDRLLLVDIFRNKQHLSLQETADCIGCSRVHLSRICKQLEEQGKIFRQ